ncbi:MAG: pyridoxamine kinase [Clostridia bacterium]|nr:pyridoxamine kinase [Clostridia bacterium]
MYQPRVLSIQDISCFGKCSLTVALPIISAMGVETCIIPTAVLSTHTGGFSGYTLRDLTDDIPKIANHWGTLGLDFDLIYTGYLSSFEQLSIIDNIFTSFGKKALKFVDPVMGDGGKLYAGFTPEFAGEMKKLCGKADIIVPNLTEASFMLNIPYLAPPYDEEYIKDILVRLTELGCRTAVLTGVMFDTETHGAMAYDSETKTFSSYFRENIDRKFHGTGDIFASTMCGALSLGKDLDYAIKVAVDFSVECIIRSLNDKDHPYGVRFEECIPYLTDYLRK